MNAHMRQAFTARLGREAWNWIAHQLPDRVFHRELEQMLRSIPELWSRVATATGADTVKAEKIDEPTGTIINALRHDLGEILSDVEFSKAAEACVGTVLARMHQEQDSRSISIAN